MERHDSFLSNESTRCLYLFNMFLIWIKCNTITGTFQKLLVNVHVSMVSVPIVKNHLFHGL